MILKNTFLRMIYFLRFILSKQNINGVRQGCEENILENGRNLLDAWVILRQKRCMRCNLWVEVIQKLVSTQEL